MAAPEQYSLAADVVLLGHGSRRGKDTDIGLREVERRLQGKLNGRSRVRMAGLEFTIPTLEAAVRCLASEEATSIAIMPFFLFDGKHVKIEIPQEIERLRKLLPNTCFTYTRTLGTDARLVQMVQERVEKALVQAPEARSVRRGVVLVTRGTPLQYGSIEGLREMAQKVSVVYDGQVRVEPAQAQFGDPTIDAAIESLVGSGAGVVVVVPYLLFPGKVLFDNIVPAVEAARRKYPYIQFCLTDTLGVDDRLIDITLDRLKEAGVAC